MRLKDVAELSPSYDGPDIDDAVSFVPMESLRCGSLDLQEIEFADAKGKYTFFADGDLLVAKVTPCFENGNIAVARGLKHGIGFGSSEIFVLRAHKGQLTGEYLFYLAQTARFQAEACATMCGVGGLKRIAPLFMRTFETEIPSPPEQLRIVAFLDEKTASIDKRIALLERKRETLKRLKMAAINHAVTRGANQKTAQKVCKSVVRLKDVSELSPVYDGPDIDDTVSFVPMESLRCGSLDPLEIAFSDAKGKYTFFADGDLLVAKVTPCFENGNIAVARGLKHGIGFGSSEIFVLRARKGKLVNEYLFYLAQTARFQAEACATMCGVGGLKRISPLFMRTFEFVCPSLSEQRTIANYLAAECTKIDAKSKTIEKQIDACRRLKRALINEVVTGRRAV